MSDRRDAVRNAADPQQVKRAERADRERQRKFLEALGEVLTTPNGRYLLWELLARASVFGSVVERDPHMTYYRAGRQDYGHQLLGDIAAADEGLYELMEREARQLARKTRDVNEAGHTPRASEGSDE